VRDRLEVDLVEHNEFISEKVERPTRVSFWRFATGEFDQSGFGIAIEFALIFAVGLAAMNRRAPSLAVVFTCVVGCSD